MDVSCAVSPSYRKRIVPKFRKWMMHWGQILWAKVFLLVGFGVISTTEANQISDAEKCSIFRVALDNAKAIKSGDVVILKREFFDGVKKMADEKGEETLFGGTLNRVSILRYAFEDDGEKMIFAERTQSDWLDLEPSLAIPEGRLVRAGVSGFLKDKPMRVHIQKVGDSVGKTPFYEGNDFLEDPRTAGMAGVGLEPFQITEKAFNTFATGEGLILSRQTKNKLEIKTSRGRDENSEATHVRHFFFDNVTSLPVESRYYIEFDKGGATQSNDTKYEWTEMSNLYVPTKIKGFATRSYYAPNQDRRNAVLSAEIDLCWLMINEPLKDGLFDESVLSDEKKFKDFLDPAKNGAQSLVEILEKLNMDSEAEKSEPKLDTKPRK